MQLILTNFNNYSEVVKQLLASGKPVRAVVRDPSKLDTLKNENKNLEVVTGDIASEEVNIYISNTYLCTATTRLVAWQKFQ